MVIQTLYSERKKTQSNKSYLKALQCDLDGNDQTHRFTCNITSVFIKINDALMSFT